MDVERVVLGFDTFLGYETKGNTMHLGNRFNLLVLERELSGTRIELNLMPNSIISS